MRSRVLGHFSNAYAYPAALPFDRRASLEQVRRCWEEFLAVSPFGRAVGMHLHIPFCRRRCSYCDCSSELLRDPARLDNHLERLTQELEYLRSTFVGTRLNRLYVGGGTPNLLAPEQLRRLAAEIDARYQFETGAVRSIELAPELCTEAGLEAVREAGFNRLSFGVQTLNERVLRAVNRPSMSQRKAARAVARAASGGFPEINVDLIFGLAGERTASFHRAVRQVGRWSPHTITIQLLANSEIGRGYRSRAHERQVAQRFADYALGLGQRLKRELPAYRCHLRPRTVVLVHRDMPRPWDRWLDFYSGQDRVAVSTVGFGLYAQSKLHGAWHLQNADNQPDFDPSAQRFVTRPYTPELEAAIDAACGLMNEGRFDPQEIARRYGQLPDSLQRRVDELLASGRLRRAGRQVVSGAQRTNPLRPLVTELAAGASQRVEENTGPQTPLRARQNATPRGGLAVTCRAAGGEWVVHVERAEKNRRYYAVVRGLGLYYGAPERWDSEAEAQMSTVMQGLLGRLDAAGVAAADLAHGSERIRSIVLAELARQPWVEVSR
ncbi:MAG: radical SAM protein [bacterium]